MEVVNIMGQRTDWPSEHSSPQPWGMVMVHAMHKPSTRRQCGPMVDLSPDTSEELRAEDKQRRKMDPVNKTGRKGRGVSTAN